MIDLSKFTLMQKRFRPLSLVVQLVDNTVANLHPAGKAEVFLKNAAFKNSRNASGHFIYLALPDGAYTVQIEPDYYLRKEFKITLPTHTTPPGGEIPLDDDVKLIDLKNALLAEVTLRPDVDYPFPSGATVMQSEVIDRQGQPVRDAVVEIFDRQSNPPNKKATFATNAQGKFALYFDRLSKLKILAINGKSYDGSKKLRLGAVHPNLGASPALDLEVKIRKIDEPDDPNAIYEGETVFKKISF